MAVVEGDAGDGGERWDFGDGGAQEREAEETTL